MSLDERIAAAFGEGAASPTVVSLLTEVEAAAAAAREEAETARMLALDPRSPDIAAARRGMEDAAFRRDRLVAAVEQLRARLAELRALEEEAARLAAYRRAEAERDSLAAELAGLYPEFERRLADLLPRLVANDREVERINALALPAGEPRLVVAELVARGRLGFVDKGVSTPRITEELRLPLFDSTQHDQYAWPPSLQRLG